MAALIGRITGSRGTASRLGTKASGISATLETWNGSITVELQADGSFQVRIGPKSSHGTTVVSGNVDDGKRTVELEDNYKGLNGSLKP